VNEAKLQVVKASARTVTSRIALVVDEDPLIQRDMAMHLEGAKFTVRTAFDFDAAVLHLATCTPDVACIDLGLPGELGYDLCEHIRSRAHLVWLPILATSERNFPEDIAHAAEVGASAFLKKPFPMDRLLKYVSALLDGPRASRPNARRASAT
jgi:two-component system response regulator PhoP